MERIVCLLVFFALKVFAQDEFIFWAELSSKNFILSYQNENVSSAMTKNANVFEEYVCDIIYTDDDLNYLQKTDLGVIDSQMPKKIKLRFLNTHKNQLIECFIGSDIRVTDVVKNSFLQAGSKTYVKMLPLRFRVDFASNKALIYRLVKKR